MLRWQKPKDPDDIDYFEIKWSKALKGDTISVSVWIVPSGVVQTTSEVLQGGTRTRVWLSGGTAGQKYVLTNRVTTAAGRQLDQSVELTVAVN
jgi:hypothetical protein